MDYIIPAKANSSRVPGKNFRAFHGDKSLVDITIQKLIQAGAEPGRIHLSSESVEDAQPVCERHGIHFLQRSEDLCDNSVPVPTWIRAITAHVPGDSDIAWCQVCDPLFDEYSEVLELWGVYGPAGYDSITVCHPWRGYLMTESCHPVGWSFGEHHTSSQNLPQWRLMPFTMSVLTRQAIKDTGYHVGRRPKWYSAKSRCIDIDTMEDFEIAQLYYAKKQEALAE